MKIKLSNDEFLKVYKENTVKESARLLNVSSGCIEYHARRLGHWKQDRTQGERINPNVIPGGLPQKGKP